VTPAERRTLESVRAELNRLVRYDDESLVHDVWIRQRYQGGFAATYAPARAEAATTAWHEAGHAVAALAVGARFSSASIRAGGRSYGRVHSIAGGGADGTGGADGFVINPKQFYFQDGSFTDAGIVQPPNPAFHRVPTGKEYQFSIDYSTLSKDPNANKSAAGYFYAPGTPVAVWR